MKYIIIGKKDDPVVGQGIVTHNFLLFSERKKIKNKYIVLQPFKIKNIKNNRYAKAVHKDIILTIKEDNNSIRINDNILIRLDIDCDSFLKKLVKQSYIEKIKLVKKPQYIQLVEEWQQLGNLSDVDTKLVKINFAPKYKVVDSSYLYRGIQLSKKQKEFLSKNKYLDINERKLTSWTTDKKVAILFAQGFISEKDKKDNPDNKSDYGIVIKRPTSNLDILVNVNTLNIPNNPYQEQKEVIVMGNGIDKIKLRDIVYKSWTS